MSGGAIALSVTACLAPPLPDTPRNPTPRREPLPPAYLGAWELFDCSPYGAPPSAGKHANARRRCVLTSSTAECTQTWDGCSVRESLAKVWMEHGEGFIDWSGPGALGCEPAGCTPIVRQTNGVEFPLPCMGVYNLNQDPVMKLAVVGDVLLLGTETVGCKFRRETSPLPEAAAPGMTQDQIRNVVMSGLAPLRICYEREAVRDPNLHGQIDVEWRIAPNGKVPEASVLRSTVGNVQVETCIVREVRRWKFPPSGASSHVEWPFRFGVSTTDKSR